MRYARHESNMAGPSGPTKLHIDSDGVRIETSGVRGGVWLLAGAMTLVAAALLMLARPSRRENVEEHSTAPRQPAVNAPALARGAQPADKPLRAAVPVSEHATRLPPAAQRPAPASAQPEEPPGNAAAEEAPMFGAAVPGEGIAVFPPPGTKPIKRGILVPEDFELPPGYVRHYQATDDGERVPAILMFHPDYHPVDEHGVPITLPEDRVVPPDMAPPGMPIEMLQVPESDNPDAAP
jgi:hypothetical protein